MRHDRSGVGVIIAIILTVAILIVVLAGALYLWTSQQPPGEQQRICGDYLDEFNKTWFEITDFLDPANIGLKALEASEVPELPITYTKILLDITIGSSVVGLLTLFSWTGFLIFNIALNIACELNNQTAQRYNGALQQGIAELG